MIYVSGKRTPPNRIRLVAIDWSGVISDDRRSVYEANMAVLTRHGKETMSFDEWLQKTTLTAVDFFRNQGIKENSEVLSDEYRREYSFARERGSNPIAYPDAIDFFNVISDAGVPAVVISSHPINHLLRESDEYGLRNYITRIYGSIRDKGKSIIDSYNEFGVRQEETIYIGDTSYDIAEARNAGVVAVGMATGYHTRGRLIEARPDILADSLKDLTDGMRMLLRG